jgi:hypothetical protein
MTDEDNSEIPAIVSPQNYQMINKNKNNKIIKLMIE